MRKFGLIGYPVSHSFSPGYFASKFEREGIRDATYEAFPLEKIENVKEVFDAGVIGFNVTIPYKESIIRYLDGLSVEAKAVKAVNTVRIVENSKTGYNTDVYGFERSLINWCGNEIPARALVLGTGGASKAVQYVLEKLKVNFHLVSRKVNHIQYMELNRDIILSHRLIVNTTPLGMAPRINESPEIPYEFLTKDHFLYDLIYNPEKTLFLKRGEKQSCRTKNGLEMLQLQAEKSWEIWNKI